MKKRRVVSMMLIILIIVSNLTIFAYASSLDSFLVDSSTRWTKYGSSHMGSTSTSFKYSSDTVKTTYSTDVTNGISMWGSYISCSYSSSSTLGKITSSASSSTATATTTPSYNTSTYHRTTWTITIYSTNFDGKSDAVKKRTIAHEIGHVYGLDHFNNSSQIMYDTSSSTKNVTSYDIAGMKVMTHAHTHGTTYTNTKESAGSTYHKVRCATCYSYKLEKHNLIYNKITASSIYPNNKYHRYMCSLCGYTLSYQTHTLTTIGTNVKQCTRCLIKINASTGAVIG